MPKSKIEWCDFSVNPVKGLCPMQCSYCYASKIYKRFKLDHEIKYNPEIFNELYKLDSGSRIFVGSTMELFGKWVKDEWMKEILRCCKELNNLTFIFLSKLPHQLSRWEFPDNCWVGISTTGNDHLSGLEDNLKNVKSKTKFVSIEPLLDYTPMDFRWVNWVIVGRQSPISEKTKPHINWIEDIVKRADEERVPVFLKDNLRSLLPEQIPLFNKNQYELRQEFPVIK